MQQINMLFPNVEFSGRNGLSRSLKTRFAETPALYTFMALAAMSAFIVGMNVVTPLLSGHFKAVLHFSHLLQVLFFAVVSYVALVLKKSAGLRVHLHAERVIYELPGHTGTGFSFADIHALRIQHKQGSFGIYFILKNGDMYHFPIHLERLDYILDTLHFHRPDLTQNAEFMKFRERALVVDHTLAHNQSLFSRGPLRAVTAFLMYPFYVSHDLKRIHADPKKVGRDMEYEKRMEMLGHRMNMGLGLVALAVVVLWKYHI